MLNRACLATFLLTMMLTGLSCQQRSGDMPMKPGPGLSVFGGHGEFDYRQGAVSSDLQWLITAPSYNMAADGTAASVDDRLTLAVQSPSRATWLLATRLTGRDALGLSERIGAALAGWASVPCLPTEPFPMSLEITLPKVRESAPGSWGRIELDAGSAAWWSVLAHPGGDLARPSIRLGVMTDGSSDVPVAVVTMDLVTAAAMRHRLAGLASTVALGAEHAVPEDHSSNTPGWTTLFDGSSLEHFRGFRKQTMPAGWEIVDGFLTRTGPGGDIITRAQYDNFEFELQWRVQPGGNSGIFFNVTEDNDHVWQTGPEMQILDDERHADGQNVLTSAGANYALHPARENLARPAGEWNTARILVCENQVTQWLNDVEVVTYTLGSSQWTNLVSASKFNAMPDYGRRVAGHIALQDHGDVVSFRNIRVRDLGASSASLRSN
ncbi:MAG: hypothetical protein CMJ24_03340 [Phycisphaerae bacterium]|nr:hypothetical protein [Phycisphaerae bacterium]